MKKLVLVFAAAAMLLAASSCGKIKSYSEPNIPADPVEGAAGGVDNSTYPFEVPGDISGFSTGGSGFSSISISSEKAYMGTASLRVDVNFTAPNMQGRLNKSGVDLSTMIGKALSGHVWVPNGMFGTSTPYGAFFLHTV